MNFIDEKIYALITGFTSQKATTCMMIISFLGSATVLISLAIASIIIFRKNKIGLYITINLATVFLLNRILKMVIRRPRPNLIQIVPETGYSFPSGHTMVGTGFYGLCIYFIYKEIKNKAVKYSLITILVLLILLIGISRIYLRCALCNRCDWWMDIWTHVFSNINKK